MGVVTETLRTDGACLVKTESSRDHHDIHDSLFINHANQLNHSDILIDDYHLSPCSQIQIRSLPVNSAHIPVPDSLRALGLFTPANAAAYWAIVSLISGEIVYRFFLNHSPALGRGNPQASTQMLLVGG